MPTDYTQFSTTSPGYTSNEHIYGTLQVDGGIVAPTGQTLNPGVVATGGAPAMASTDGTNATPVVTEYYYAQFNPGSSMTITGLANFNGSVASGNIKVGIADSTGAILATSASTAMSGTDAYQKVALTAPLKLVGPGTYFALLFVDNTTARVNCWPIGAFIAGKVTGQVYATGFTAFTPATTFTADLGPMMSLY